MRLLFVSLQFTPERRHRVGRLALKDGDVLFEYDPEFLRSGLEISPLRLPLQRGLIVGDRRTFDGLPGVFEDSLPDGWGRLLLDRAAAKQGLSPSQLTPLDRLAVVGSHGIGALVYEPELAKERPTVVDLREIEAETRSVLRNGTGADLDKLIVGGGSPQGARPKLLVQLSGDGEVLIGSASPVPGYEPYLVKFRGEGDAPYAASLEHAYMLMAEAAGISVPPSKILGMSKGHPGYFAVRRFDRIGGARVHQHTLSGLLHAPHHYPALGYRELLLTTRTLTRDEGAVAEMFRRACFNVFAHNRDDHSRNFAFLMDERGAWRPSPAYDLTLSDGPGGEHSLLIGDEGRKPTREHLERLAESADVRGHGQIISEVTAAVRSFSTFAARAKLPASATKAVAAKHLRPPFAGRTKKRAPPPTAKNQRRKWKVRSRE